MSKKKAHHEDHVDEAWLLPYSDMLTLLLALFIVMFAMSKVDKEKFINLSKQFNAIFQGGTGLMESGGGTSKLSNENGASQKVQLTNVVVEQDKMSSVKKKLQKEIEGTGYKGRIAVELNSEGLMITIQDSVIFNSGVATIMDKFDPLLLKIADMIRNLDNDIRISGHTDNIPIQNYYFHSNWDLSFARAENVMTFLVNQGSMVPNRFSIQAYGEYSPKYTNATEQGRAKNRRVEILIVRKYH